MPKKLDWNKWACSICGKEHSLSAYAVSCEQSHDTILVPFKRDDLQRLMQFMVTGDQELLTTTLIETLQKYKHQMRGESE